MEYLLGKEQSLVIKNKIVEEISSLEVKPSLFVLVNQDDSSSIGYVSSLEKNATSLGFRFVKILMSSSKEEYIEKIKELNDDPSCNAIMVTRPLFKGANEKEILSYLNPLKDVDVMNSSSLGEVFIGNDQIAPATSRAIMEILSYYKIDVEGKNVLVIGRSISVGKPVAMMLLNKNATVTIAHSKTKDLDEQIKRNDIIVCAVGKPHFLDSSKVKDHAIIIDAGIHYLDDGRIVGDVKPCLEKDIWLSKVPGGVGSLTSSVLFDNVLKLYYKQRNS